MIDDVSLSSECLEDHGNYEIRSKGAISCPAYTNLDIKLARRYQDRGFTGRKRDTVLTINVDASERVEKTLQTGP